MENFVPKGEFFALYAYGSRVYGNAQPRSDYDYVGIREGVDKGSIIQGKINVKLMSPEHFQSLLDEHRMTALECYFLPDRHILKAPERPWHFSLDKRKLHDAVLARVNENWTRAEMRLRRSLEDRSEAERGKKCIYHSLRLLMFGMQIAELSTISNYGAANHIFEHVMTDPSIDWEHYEKEWRLMKDAMLATFELLTAKKR